MAVSNIVVSNLKTIADVRGVKLQWSVSDPNSNGLPYLTLKTVEIWASDTNDRATASKISEGLTDALCTGLMEEITYYFWIRPLNNSAIYGDWYPASTTEGVVCTAIGMSGLAFGLANGKIATSVAGNALTIAIKTNAGKARSLARLTTHLFGFGCSRSRTIRTLSR
jgi:hypothetical protein